MVQIKPKIQKHIVIQLTRLYIPYGSDKTESLFTSATPIIVFISHMVQIKQ